MCDAAKFSRCRHLRAAKSPFFTSSAPVGLLLQLARIGSIPHYFVAFKGSLIYPREFGFQITCPQSVLEDSLLAIVFCTQPKSDSVIATSRGCRHPVDRTSAWTRAKCTTAGW